MSPALDVRAPISALAVSNRHINNVEIQACSSQDEVKISKGIQVPEVCAVRGYHFVPIFPQNLGAAEGILDRLTQ